MSGKKMTMEQQLSWRTHCIENLRDGLGLVPWGYSPETREAGEVPARDAHRVCCVPCGIRWRWDQRAYIKRHFREHHRMEHAVILHGMNGGTKRDEERAQLREELERLAGGKIKGL